MNLSSSQLKLLIKYLSFVERNPMHLAAIEDALINMEFFQKLKQKNHLKQLQQCWKNISYHRLERGQTVFYKGAWPKEFYIILKGEVSILIPKDQETLRLHKEQNKKIDREIESKIQKSHEAKQNQSMEMSKINNKMRKILIIPSGAGLSPVKIAKSMSQYGGSEEKFEIYSTPTLLKKRPSKRSPIKMQKSVRDLLLEKAAQLDIKDQTIQNLMLDKIEDLENRLSIGDLEEPDMYFDGGTFKYKQINTLKDGRQFGETGLILLQGRTATVLCLEDCHFAIFTKEHFDKIFLELLHLKIVKKAQTIQKSLGLNLHFNLMMQISNCFRKVVVSLSTYLFVEGDEAMDIYVVKKGEVQLLKNSKDTDPIKKVKVLKSFQGIPLDHQVKLATYGQDVMIGHQDVLTNGLRQFTVQVTSSQATFYVTDKQQFKAALSDINTAQRLTVQQNIEQFQNYMNTKVIQYQQISDLAVKAKITTVINKKAGSLRTSVKDIEQYLDGNKNGNPLVISEKVVHATYGAIILDKLELMQSLLHKFPIPKELDNDQYIQAFDKAGIERKLKKLRLRRKILTRGNNSKVDVETLNQMLKLKIPSTRDKIMLQRQIASGEFRIAVSRSKKNLSWEKILSYQLQEKSQPDRGQAELSQIELSNERKLRTTEQRELRKTFESQIALSTEQNCVSESIIINKNLTKNENHSSKVFLKDNFNTENFFFPRSPQSIMIDNQGSGFSSKLKPRSAVSGSYVDQSRSRPQTSASKRTNFTKTCFYNEAMTNSNLNSTKAFKELSQKDTSISKTRPNTAISKKVFRQVLSANPIEFLDVQFPSAVFDFSEKRRSETKYQYNYVDEVKETPTRPSTALSRTVMLSTHNLYRFGSPQMVQENILRKRFNKKK